MNRLPIVAIVRERPQHHLLIRQRRLPAQLPPNPRRVEHKTLRDHAVVIRPQRRDIQLVRQLHQRNRGG